MLSKYVASDGKTPKINKLNDGRFQKTKHKVQTQVEDIADDLIKLYAERSQLEGFAYSKDDENQEAFEQDFPYIETDDQLRSIEEIKKDMESNRPMDRLLVGDVGFGENEVAMRAAFKAVNDHKQVAVLVPTTVLAQQHYANFKERFESFAVEVAVLSRFQSKAEQKETLEKLKKGRVDIIIGTHRLLSKDVVFSDLGLIVIDEEQRFGVKHKETLKELKKKGGCAYLDSYPYTSNSSYVYARNSRFICHRNTSDQSVSCANFCIRDQSNHYSRRCVAGDGSWRTGLLSLQ